MSRLHPIFFVPSVGRHSSLGSLSLFPFSSLCQLYRFNSPSDTQTRGGDAPGRDRRPSADGRDKGLGAGEGNRGEKAGPLFFTEREGKRDGNRGDGRRGGEKSRVVRTETTTRGGVVRCGQICWGLLFLSDLYFINYVRADAHPRREGYEASRPPYSLSASSPA